ncbi:MAG: hypothetical protein IPQ13_13460 [Holophagaceae bacterium]|nr:hypothetical protein [Holophagaceae bacterium]
MTARRLFPIALLSVALACSQVSTREAKALVIRYNSVVCEAYRKGDIKIIDSVVGPDAPDGRRLTGLIGVRMDMGLTLDANLESLELVGVDQAKEVLTIRTRETWRYRDLKSGTQQQVGEASVDRYEMLYHFRKHEGAWLVEETRFTSPPQVGRKETPWSMDARDAHAMAPPPPAEGKKP